MSRTLERFPELYKLSKTNGKITIWKIWVEGSAIHTETGYIDGKMKPSKDIIKSGKNIGRANETTAEEQAFAEAKSKWTKYRDKGYTINESGVPSKGDEIFAPMLAHDFLKYGHKLSLPFYVQPKLDGIRANPIKGKFMSRNGKPLAKMANLMKHVKAMFDEQVTDGEIYNHSQRANFEGISSGARKTKGKSEYEDVMQYHVYDIASHDGTFKERRAYLKKIMGGVGSPLVRRVPTYLVATKQELEEIHEKFLEEGYEGTMIRVPDSLYEPGRRSYGLMKYKPFNDSEFRIVGMEEGRGQLMGHVGKFICEISDERGTRTFKAKLGGKNITPFLKKCFTDHKLWKGKWMQVHYMGISNKNYKPRHPRGIKLRDIE